MQMVAVFLLGPLGISGHVDSWDQFRFTQEWPQTACIMGKSEDKGCQIPTYINSFTIHGLWPSSRTGMGPANCSGPPFNMALIRNLTAELNTSWPNIFSNTRYDDFWNHEWDTHGKCALSVPQTGTEYLFFKTALDLMRKYNVSRYLNKANITADNKYHTYAKVDNTIKQQLGVQPDIYCHYGKTNSGKKVMMLAEIRLCMSKSFVLEDCEGSTTLFFKSRKHQPQTEPCSKKRPFLFPKITRK